MRLSLAGSICCKGCQYALMPMCNCCLTGTAAKIRHEHWVRKGGLNDSKHKEGRLGEPFLDLYRPHGSPNPHRIEVATK